MRAHCSCFSPGDKQAQAGWQPVMMVPGSVQLCHGQGKVIITASKAMGV